MIDQICKIHGQTLFYENKDRPRCRLCAIAAVAKTRKKIKETLVKEAGGKCHRCNFDKHPAALQFHHADPTTKKFKISDRNTKGIAKLREEAKKCLLICANCHAIEHATPTKDRDHA